MAVHLPVQLSFEGSSGESVRGMGEAAAALTVPCSHLLKSADSVF